MTITSIVILYVCKTWCHVKWVPCHHGIARPQVADGREGLQIQRVAENILNKQSRTVDKGWSSSLKVGCGATQPLIVKKKLRNVSKRLGSGLILWHDLSNGKGHEIWTLGT